MSATATSIPELDVTRRRGTFVVVTRSGTNYYVEADKRQSGMVRLTSDGDAIKCLTEGIVCHRSLTDSGDRTIKVGFPMVVGRFNGQLIVGTNVVVSITPADTSLDDLVCSRCKTGFKPPDEPCHLCHYSGT